MELPALNLPVHVEIDCHGERLWLLADHAIWWPAQRTLLIADAHFGKAATYRVLGQPVPHGTTQHNVERIDALLDLYPARHIVFLGDFLHGPQVHRSTGPTFDTLLAWRARHPDLLCTLVRGNHDARAGDPPKALQFEVVNEPFLMGSLALCHHPQRHPTHYVLAGHEHPVFVLRGRGRDSLRLPGFVFDDGAAVLPAFGDFTGGYAVQHAPGRRIYVAGGGGVWQVQGHVQV